MDKKKSVVKNYIYNVSYQILTILAPLITSPYISRVLGPENVGTYSYTASITTYFITLAILGSDGYARREIAYCQNNRRAYSKLFKELVIFRIITTFISLGLFFGVIWREENRILYLVQSINIIAVATDITWFFQGMEEFGKIVLRNFVLRLLNIVSIFLFVKSSEDLIIYIFLLAFLPFLAHISMWTYLPKYIEMGTREKIQLKRHLKGIISLFIPTIAVSIYSALDKTMIGYFSESSVQNGYYEQADKIVKMLITIVNALGFVMAPRIASSIAEGNNEKVRKYMAKSYQYVICLSLPMFFGLFLLSDRFVPWFFGEEYQAVIPVLKILSLLIPIVGMSNLTGVQYFVSIKKEKIFTTSLFSGAIVNFVLNLFLIPNYYAAGAAISTILGEATILFFGVAYILLIEKRLTVKDVLGNMQHYFVASAVMYMIVSMMDRNMSDSIINMFVLAIVGCIVYIFSLIILKDELVCFVLEKFKKFIRGE